MMIKRLFLISAVILIAVLAYASSQQTSSTAASTLINEAEVILNDTDNRMWTAGELLTWLNHGMVDIVRRTHCLESTETIFLDVNTIEYTITSTYLTVKAVQYVDGSHVSYSLKKGSPSSVGQNTVTTIPTYWYDWAGKLGVYPALSTLANAASAKTITNAANNGSGLIRITTSAAHGYSTGDHVTIASVSGTTEANADWTITVISTTTFDLVGSTYSNAYTSGGTVYEAEVVKVYLITRPTAIAATANVTTPAIYDEALVQYIVAQAYRKDLQFQKYAAAMSMYEAELDRARLDLNEYPKEVVE